MSDHNWSLEIHFNMSEFWIGIRKAIHTAKYKGCIGPCSLKRTTIQVCLIPMVPITLWWEEWE